jgi:hypothetical protein
MIRPEDLSFATGQLGFQPEAQKSRIILKRWRGELIEAGCKAAAVFHG